MKKIIVLLLAIVLFKFDVYAQATNTFPPNGKAGIGTLTPASNLDINDASPEQRFVNSADGSFARFLRGTTSSNNFFTGKNQVAQVGSSGSAVQFNGSNQYYTGSDAGLPTGSSVNMTVSFWLKTTQGTHTGIINYGTGAGQFQIYVDASLGKVGLYANGNLGYTGPGSNLADGSWHHYVVVLNGNSAILYIDGSSTNFALYIPYNIALSGTLSNNFIGTGVGYASGSIDQLLIYNRALSTTSGSGSSDEIGQLYNGGSGTASVPAGAIRKYDFDEGTNGIANDANITGIQYPLTLVNESNSISWVTPGIAPVSSLSSESVFFSSADGLTNGEKGIATWGDFNGRNQQQGKWFQWFQGSHYPLVSDNNGHWLFNPNNTSATLPAVASTVDVAGNVTIGSGYSGVNAAPANGLLVQGNVGIGTTSPATALVVNNGELTVNANGSLTQGGEVFRAHNQSDANILIATPIGGITGGSALVAINDAGNTIVPMEIRASPLIISDGSVAIGTTDPRGFKLAVNGSAIAESITVQLHAAWPDYVFKPSYALPTLSEVKTYIDKNQHLPEMPSEQEIAEKGLNLGEMNKLLVKKVEELTLYLMEKDKQVNTLSEKLQQQAEQLQKLQHEFETLRKQ